MGREVVVIDHMPGSIRLFENQSEIPNDLSQIFGSNDQIHPVATSNAQSAKRSTSRLGCIYLLAAIASVAHRDRAVTERRR